MADYFVEGDEVLENKLNIIDPTKLKEIEEALVAREGMCIIEWEWFQRPGKARSYWVFEGLRPSVATIWQHFFIIHKKRANWFWLVS